MNITDLAERRRLRAHNEPPQFASVGIHVEFTKSDTPRFEVKSTSEGLRIDEPLANYDRHNVDAEDVLEARRAAAIARRQYEDRLRRLRAFLVGLLIGACWGWCLYGYFHHG